MTTLAVFYTYVKGEAKRGTSLDDVIPRAVARAVRKVERLYTFKHMERFLDIYIPAAGVEGIPNQVPCPAGFKSMQFWRLLNSDPTGQSNAVLYTRINKVDATDQSQLDTGAPAGYWEDGYNNFWLDKTPDQDYSSEMGFIGYTVLPGDNDDSIDVPLLTSFEDVILYEAMIQLGPNIRDQEITAMYKMNRDESLKTVIDSDIENRQAGRSESMQYGWEFKEEVNVNKTDSIAGSV